MKVVGKIKTGFDRSNPAAMCSWQNLQRHVAHRIAPTTVTGAAAHGARLNVIVRARSQVLQHHAPGLRENPGGLPAVGSMPLASSSR